jgi:1-acyl-sn-glycerol-3-phosphate acyltransferase
MASTSMVESKNPLLNMKLSITPLLLLVGIISSSTEGFICHPPRAHLISLRRVHTSSNNKRPSVSSSRPSTTTTTLPAASDASIAAASTDSSSSSSPQPTTKHQSRLHQIRSEGGPLSFNTKYGALNPYAIYYGLTSIALGIVWFMALSIMQLIYKCTGGEDGKFDKKRRIPVFLSHVWGYTLMMLTGCFPTIENGEILRQFHTSSKNKAAMFVSNHNSWMDIPFIGYAIGWHNYKFVAKKELERVPILGKAIMISRNVCVDRKDRKSQLMTLKSGMKWLEVSVVVVVVLNCFIDLIEHAVVIEHVCCLTNCYDISHVVLVS